MAYLYILDIGMCAEGIDLAVTVTLNPKIRKHMASDQYDLSYERVMDMFHDLGLDVVLMVAELHKSFDIHYHGIVRGRISPDKLGFILRNKTRNDMILGYCMVKPVENNGWAEYCLEDVEVTKEYIQRCPIVRDSRNYWTGEKQFRALPVT